MSKETGGPAFPPNAGWRDNDPKCQGMTLRDWFAGQALMGIEASQGIAGEFVATAEGVAERAYRMADAMLKERDK